MDKSRHFSIVEILEKELSPIRVAGWGCMDGLRGSCADQVELKAIRCALQVAESPATLKYRQTKCTKKTPFTHKSQDDFCDQAIFLR